MYNKLRSLFGKKRRKKPITVSSAAYVRPNTEHKLRLERL
jgi:hypothetical protein